MMLASSPASILNHKPKLKGIPFDSDNQGNALDAPVTPAVTPDHDLILGRRDELPAIALKNGALSRI